MEYIIILILMIIMEVTRPVPKPPKKPGLGDFNVPTAEQDRPVPVFWGKPWLDGPNLVWYGDLKISKIKKKIKGMFTSKTQVIGYKYSLGFHLVFGYGDDNTILKKIAVAGSNGSAETVWSGSLAGGNGSISRGDLWGGEEEGGGMVGTFTFMSGARTQGQNSYLRGKLGSRMPAYRGVCGVSWNRGYHGTQTVLKNWIAQIERLPRGLSTVYYNINGEANAAEIQYELLTNSSFGMGLTADEIDVASFRSCAQKIHGEGLGISMVWDNTKSLEDILKEIDRHVESITFINPTNGKWTMRLIRADYDIDTLPRVNKKNAQLIKFTRPTADELVNEMIVTYSSEEYQGKNLPVRVQDTAAYQNRDNQRVTVTAAYPGFTQPSLAKIVCTRDMRSLSYPYARVQLELDRSFYDLAPVDRLVFDWEFPDGNIENMPMIVMERSIGSFKDGKIVVTCAQDVFGLGEALYTEGGGSGWTPINKTALPPTAYRMEFSPYWILKQDPDVPGPLAAVPMLMVEEPNAAHLSYDVQYTDPSLGGQYLPAPDSQPFTPTGKLLYDYLESAGQDASGSLILTDLTGLTEVPVGTANDLRYLGAGLVVIDNEIMGFTAAVQRLDGTWAITGVKRALLDTTAERHLAGARAWFMGDALGRTPTQLLPFASGTYKAKLITRAMAGTLDPLSAPVVTLTTNGSTTNARPLYAYPVRNLKVNGSTVPGKVPANEIAVTWNHSNKEQEDYIYFQDDTPLAKPGDTTYRVYLYDDTGAQKAVSGTIVGNSYTFAVGDVVGGLPTSGYVQVVTLNAAGQSNRATLWFGRQVDYASTQDAGPQRLLDEAVPWSFIRMAD